MTQADYEREKPALSLQFLREKREGVIATNTGWAEWCWARGVYPLDTPKN